MPTNDFKRRLAPIRQPLPHAFGRYRQRHHSWPTASSQRPGWSQAAPSFDSTDSTIPRPRPVTSPAHRRPHQGQPPRRYLRFNSDVFTQQCKARMSTSTTRGLRSPSISDVQLSAAPVSSPFPADHRSSCRSRGPASRTSHRSTVRSAAFHADTDGQAPSWSRGAAWIRRQHRRTADADCTEGDGRNRRVGPAVGTAALQAPLQPGWPSSLSARSAGRGRALETHGPPASSTAPVRQSDALGILLKRPSPYVGGTNICSTRLRRTNLRHAYCDSELGVS